MDSDGNSTTARRRRTLPDCLSGVRIKHIQSARANKRYLDQEKRKGHVDKVVRSSVEETLNALLNAEADQICQAQRYEHSPERVDRRARNDDRTLKTKAGEVRLKVPKLRTMPVETAIIERYRHLH